ALRGSGQGKQLFRLAQRVHQTVELITLRLVMRCMLEAEQVSCRGAQFQQQLLPVNDDIQGADAMLVGGGIVGPVGMVVRLMGMQSETDDSGQSESEGGEARHAKILVQII